MTTTCDILSHNSNDKLGDCELAEALHARGLGIWLGEREIVPGRPWQEALEEVIETTRVPAVLVGKDGFPAWGKTANSWHPHPCTLCASHQAERHQIWLVKPIVHL